MKDRASASKAAEFKGDGAAGGRWYYTAGGGTWLLQSVVAIQSSKRNHFEKELA